MSWPDNECGPGAAAGAAEPMTLRRALEEVYDERRRQEKKWGRQDHELPHYFTILSEEVGEVAKAIVEREAAAGTDAHLRGLLLLDVRSELVRAAAVAVAMVERIDRQIERGEA